MMNEKDIIEMIYAVFILCLGISIGFTTNMGYLAYIVYPVCLIIGHGLSYILNKK